MKRAIPVIIVMIMCFFAGTALAGQMQIIRQGGECLEAQGDYVFYKWRADVENFATCPMNAHVRINVYDQKGNRIDTLYRSIDVPAKHQKHFEGKGCAECKSRPIGNIRARIENVQRIGR